MKEINEKDVDCVTGGAADNPQIGSKVNYFCTNKCQKETTGTIMSILITGELFCLCSVCSGVQMVKVN